MIVSGGENVYPVEVEEALSHHPDVLEVAVIGIPDDRWVEAVTALVVLRPGAVAEGRGADRVRPRAPRRLQAPTVDRVRRRASPHAERQGAQAGAAGALPGGRAARLSARLDLGSHLPGGASLANPRYTARRASFCTVGKPRVGPDRSLGLGQGPFVVALVLEQARLLEDRLGRDLERVGQ